MHGWPSRANVRKKWKLAIPHVEQPGSAVRRARNRLATIRIGLKVLALTGTLVARFPR